MDDATRAQAQKVVRPLVDVAFSDTGAAEAAAQALLSCYDGSRFHLCVRDLCLLDDSHYRAALLVIRLRIEKGIEPHELFDDEELFPKLCKRWGTQLHVISRGEQYGC
ncbi:DUF7673 family protein [Endozoicomonas sp. ALC066]|uniref:DUF7673 family protein n=1 Tax=Endozoicomonas sp. ALC066 TaxID=3403078 RepID=UPI003BB4FD60